MTGLTEEGFWIVGADNEDCPPILGMPTDGHIPSLLVAMQCMGVPNARREDFVYTAAWQAFRTVRFLVHGPHCPLRLAIRSVRPTLHGEPLVEFDGWMTNMRALHRDGVATWHYETKLLTLLGVTAESLERFPYDVPELGEAWTRYLASHSLTTILAHSRMPGIARSTDVGLERVQQWLTTLDADPKANELRLSDYLDRH